MGAGEVAYRRAGTGPDVLFVHGWPVSSATFRTLLPYLVGHVTCHLIDLPSAGSSRFDTGTPLSIEQHFTTVRRVVDLLGLDDVAVVGHDSGGLIARHAMAGDPRLRAMGLIDTEVPCRDGASSRSSRPAACPGSALRLGWVAGARRIRRSGLMFGGAFADRDAVGRRVRRVLPAPLHEIPRASGRRGPGCCEVSTCATSSIFPASTRRSMCRYSWSGVSTTPSFRLPKPGR